MIAPESIPRLWLGVAGALLMVGLGVCLALGLDMRVRSGFLVGAVLVLLNALASARKVRRADFRAQGGTAALLMLDSAFRMAILGVCVYMAVKILGVDPLGLIAGLSVVPVGMLLTPLILVVCNRNPGEV